eukprot:GDKK01014663.1.p1 GENE.GDKK01014663.1~~GDKK01014663.1.p1  ORF type:complete len:132 (-),score=14.38 GDKK01014663.1:22-378(-)
MSKTTVIGEKLVRSLTILASPLKFPPCRNIKMKGTAESRRIKERHRGRKLFRKIIKSTTNNKIFVSDCFDISSFSSFLFVLCVLCVFFFLFFFFLFFFLFFFSPQNPLFFFPSPPTPF